MNRSAVNIQRTPNWLNKVSLKREVLSKRQKNWFLIARSHLADGSLSGKLTMHFHRRKVLCAGPIPVKFYFNGHHASKSLL